MPPELDLGCAVLRTLTLSDAPLLARHANDRQIWLQLRDVFPHPYQEEDAREFIERIRLQNQPTAFALAVEGHAVGVIGLITREFPTWEGGGESREPAVARLVL